jgi:hypothetical protein
MDNTLSYKLTLKDFFKKTMLGAVDDTKKLDSGMNKLNNTISKVGAGIATYFGAQAILGFGKSVIDALKNYEYFSASIRTLMFGDALAAKALEGQLVKLAATSPFSLVETQEGAKQLLAYGFSAGEVTKNMKMLGDISSAVNKPLSEITYLYGTLRTQGRAFTKDINQFTTAGINLLPQLAKQFGVTQQAIMGPNGLVESGKVGFKDVEKAFQAMTSAGGQFFGMMDVQSKTVGGQISNMGDSWTQLQVNIGKSQTGIIAGTVSFFSQSISMLSKYFADANKMQENFAKNGAEQFGFWRKAWHETLGVLTGYHWGDAKIAAQENFQRNIEGMSQPKTLQDAYKNKADLYKISILKDEQLKHGKITPEDAVRFQATIKGALSDLEGSIRLMKSGGKITQADAEKAAAAAAAAKIGSPTEVSGARPQNVQINVEKFGVIEHLEVENMKDASAAVREDWGKELLEILNDANLIARR